MIAIGTTTVVTGPNGLAAFNLTEGDYTVEIGGYIYTFSVPETNYVDADICSEVTFHITDDQGNPLEAVFLDIDGLSLITNYNGEANTCLQVGNFSYEASKSGYVTQTGTFEVDTVPQTIEIVMPLQTYGVTIHVTGYECDNTFDELLVITNGDTVQVGQPIFLQNGSYDFEIAIEGCLPLETASIEVFNAPLTIDVNIDNFPKAYFYVRITELQLR